MKPAASRVLIDDHIVRVWEWTMSPGTETGDHVHGLDYLVIYLTPGTLTVKADGTLVEAAVTAHLVTSRPAGVAHNVMNRSSEIIKFIEIELKRH